MKYLLLIVALILGTFLRLWQLGEVPNGLTWDEAAIGYNAFSILKTGRDEHGALLPVIFKSFGDYKPGAYIYLTVPSVAVFGLTEFAVRFPSALAGILAILGIYLLVSELDLRSQISDLSKNSKEGKYSKLLSDICNLPSLCALALAISPWAVHFSHGAWEVNVFSTLLLFALYYFLRFIKGTKPIYPALLFACLSLAMYQAAKLLTPLAFILCAVIYWPSFWQNFSSEIRSKRVIFTIPLILFGGWVLFGSIFGSAGNRLNRLSIFNYRPNLSADLPFFHNQIALSTELVASRYLYHFSPEVLLYEGPRVSMRGHIPGLGMLNPLEIIWLVFGLIYLAKSISSDSHDIPDKATVLILGLLLISPIPASLTLEEFSTVRSLFMVMPLAIISGMGMYQAIKSLSYLSLPLFPIYALLSVYSFDLYFNHSQTVFATEFNYGYKQVVQIIKDNPSKKVIFTDVYGQPYIYYLFYTAYDPTTYQKNVDFLDGGVDVGRVGHVGDVEFHQFGTSEMALFKDTLFIGSEGNINNQYDITGPNVSLFKQIETPDHHILFRVIKTKP